MGGISFGNTSSTSAGGTTTGIVISAPVTSQISGTGAVSVSVNASTISIGVNAVTAYAASNTTQATQGGLSLSSLYFNGAGIVSVGITNGSVNISATGGGNTVETVTIIGNTTGQSASGTVAQSAWNVSAAGGLSAGYSASSVILSGPVSTSLSGVAPVSLPVNASTISFELTPIQKSIWPPENLTAISAPGNASMSIQYFPCAYPLSFSRVDGMFGLSLASSATTNTCAIAMSVYCGISTKNAATLSSLTSGSTQTTYSLASNSGGVTQLIGAGVRAISCPLAYSMTPGEYYVGYNLITATSSIGLSTTNLGVTWSVYGGALLQSASNYVVDFSAATASSTGLQAGMGVYASATTGMPTAVSLSAVAQTGSSYSQANIALVFRNV